ncbi:MAG: phosphate acyltransferase [Bacteroidales bacterium]|nr:phosphate acyltransferase [Bacteroidales bacterium]
MLRIGLDAMGGDYAPLYAVLGAMEASQHKDIKLYLFGDETAITGILKERNINPGSFVVVNCSQVIEFSDHPVSSFIKKKDSSISRGFQMLANGEIDAFASAGNTGAMMAGCSTILKLVGRINRPCISVELPLPNGKKVLLLDVGFNSECRPENLLQFAFLGSVYARTVMKVDNPKVALLNIGEEKEKGTLVLKEAYSLISDNENLNFIGNIEPDKLFTLPDLADVVVTDGFTGNIFLKQAESIYSMVEQRAIKDSYLEQFNYELYGGTPVLGVSSAVIIGHGRSTPKAIANMIFKAEEVLKSNLIDNFNIFAN